MNKLSKYVLFFATGPLIGVLFYFLFMYMPSPDKTKLNVVKGKMENTIGALTKDSPRYCGDEIYNGASSLINEYDDLVYNNGWSSEKSDPTYIKFRDAFNSQTRYKQIDQKGYESAMKLLERYIDDWSPDNHVEWKRLMRQDKNGQWINDTMTLVHLDTINSKYQKMVNKPKPLDPSDIFKLMTWDNIQDGSESFLVRFHIDDPKLEMRVRRIMNMAHGVGREQYEECYKEIDVDYRHSGYKAFYMLEKRLMGLDTPSSFNAGEKTTNGKKK